jgi:general stress protein 26
MVIDHPAARSIVRRAKIVRIATVSRTGRPQIMPLWYIVDRGRILMSNAETSPTVRNIAGDPRAVLLFEDAPGGRYVRVEGTARYTREAELQRRLVKGSIAKYYLSPGALLSAARNLRRLGTLRRYYRERAAAAGVIEVTPERWEMRTP